MKHWMSRVICMQNLESRSEPVLHKMDFLCLDATGIIAIGSDVDINGRCSIGT